MRIKRLAFLFGFALCLVSLYEFLSDHTSYPNSLGRRRIMIDHLHEVVFLLGDGRHYQKSADALMAPVVVVPSVHRNAPLPAVPNPVLDAQSIMTPLVLAA